jgi:hypothetical protein
MRKWVRFGQAVLVSAMAFTLAGCPYQAMVVRDVKVAGDSWSLNIQFLQDGPDAFSTGGFGATYYTPAAGERFFWLRVTLRNDAWVTRVFNFERCDLDVPYGPAAEAALVATAPVVFKADSAVTLRPGESVDRYLIFAYPRNVSPARLYCAPMAVRLPPIAPR